MGDEAKNHLSKMQREALEDQGINLHEARQKNAFAREILDKALKNLPENNLLDIGNPTEYENPGSYAILTNLVKDIEYTINNTEFKEKDKYQTLTQNPNMITKKPFLGTIPTGKINARTTYLAPSDDYIVAIDSQLFIFCNQLSKIVARSMPVKPQKSKFIEFSFDKEDVENNLESNEQIENKFLEFLGGYVSKGITIKPAQYSIPRPYSGLGYLLRDSMEYFAVSHEYAHMLAGHMQKTKRVITKLKERDIEECVYSWTSEIEADVLGLSLMLAVMYNKKIDITLSYTGAEMFFSCLEIIDLCEAHIHNIDEEKIKLGINSNGTISSHPPSNMRREILRSAVIKEHGESSIAAGVAIDHIIKTLWKKVKNRL